MMMSLIIELCTVHGRVGQGARIRIWYLRMREFESPCCQWSQFVTQQYFFVTLKEKVCPNATNDDGHILISPFQYVVYTQYFIQCSFYIHASTRNTPCSLRIHMKNIIPSTVPTARYFICFFFQWCVYDTVSTVCWYRF